MLIATLGLDPDGVALAETFARLPDIEVKAERVAAHATEWTMPDLWITADDFDAVDDALAADPSVETVVGSTRFVDEAYYQIDWSDEVDDRIDAYVDHEGSVLNARGTADGWRVRLRFVSRDQFDRFRHTLRDREDEFELLALVEPNEAFEPVVDLTPAQQEALTAAKERGYFEVPREVSTRELAAELDMSHQNLSNLLRRGTEKLIEKTIDVSTDADAS